MSAASPTPAQAAAPRKILVVMGAVAASGAPATCPALHHAAALAERHGAALEAIACVEPPHDLAILARLSGQDQQSLIAEAVAQARAAAEAQLEALAPARAAALHVVVGKAYLEVISHVARSGCDFVVKQAEPLVGVHRFFLASTDQHLLRKCPCPVWLLGAPDPAARPAATPRPGALPARILAAVDLDLGDAAEPDTLTGLNRRVVEAACAVAAGPGAEVIVLHAWEAMGEGMVWAFSGSGNARISTDRYVNEILETRHRAMTRLLDELEGAAPAPLPRLTPRLVKGAPEVVIEEQSRTQGAELVVMGTVARTGLSGVFIGNTAENIINSLDCPVLAVKPDGFVSPLLQG